MPTEKRYYWLKLKRDFFKRHDIEIVEAMPNGKDYVLFYLKLLIESIDHEGALRFSDTIPYDEQMISVITRTNIDIVRSAMKIFEHLNLVEIMDDKTIYLKEAAKLLGCESYSAERVRNYREKQESLISALHCDHNVQKSDEEIEIEKEKEIEIDKEKESRADKPPKKRFSIPLVSEIEAYCKERNNKVNAQHFFDWYQSKGWMVGKNKMVDWRATVRTWEQRDGDKTKGQTITERMADM
jgi:predicted phage replisome organizer